MLSYPDEDQSQSQWVVLFTLGDWQICEEVEEIPSMRIFGVHDCKDDMEGASSYSWFVDEDPAQPMCWNCKAPVPDEIQGLIQLLHAGLKP